MVRNAVQAGSNSLQFSAVTPSSCDPHLRFATPASRGNVPRTETKFKLKQELQTERFYWRC